MRDKRGVYFYGYGFLRILSNHFNSLLASEIVYECTSPRLLLQYVEESMV